MLATARTGSSRRWAWKSFAVIFAPFFRRREGPPRSDAGVAWTGALQHRVDRRLVPLPPRPDAAAVLAENPADAAIAPALIVLSATAFRACLQHAVVESVGLGRTPHVIERSGALVLKLRDEVIPIIDLGRYSASKCRWTRRRGGTAVVISARLGIFRTRVDAVLNGQESSSASQRAGALKILLRQTILATARVSFSVRAASARSAASKVYERSTRPEGRHLTQRPHAPGAVPRRRGLRNLAALALAASRWSRPTASRIDGRFVMRSGR